MLLESLSEAYSGGLSRHSLKIGELASAAEISIETIRYYESEGILTQPVKPARGARLYPSAYIGRIRFVKFAKQLGFTLIEIREWLDLVDGSNASALETLSAVNAKISQKIDELEKFEKVARLKIEVLQDFQSLIQNSKSPADQRVAGIVGLFQIYSKPSINHSN